MLEQAVAENGLRGAILNMASVLAESPEPVHFATHAYAASKGAILAMTKAMAAYYAPHKIRVNAIAPGLVRTPMSRRAQEDAEILAYIGRKQPLAEDLIPAEDIARASVFLMSDEARMITGETLTVDAGWSVTP
jgi:NAD(P)-dependent dehydrogenase (short-subunit alcohol dehydrogenase family)